MERNKLLWIDSLRVERDGTEILHGIDLTLPEGEFHIIVGQNGSGKSTLAMTIAGNPLYRITEGRLIYRGEDITHRDADWRARNGIFVGFQHPPEISGVRTIDFMKKLAEIHRGMEPVKAHDLVMDMASELDFTPEDLKRDLNGTFSGGEKKRLEILQAMIIRPDIMILDEIDSGVDVDSLHIIGKKVNEMLQMGTTVVMITHYPRILENIQRGVDAVHILRNGRMIYSGDAMALERIDSIGFQKFYEECGCQ